MLSPDEIKKQVGVQAAQLIQSGMTIGIGTGTTAHWLIIELAKKIKEGLQCKAVPTSLQTKELAEKEGIPLLELNDVMRLDLTIDGADEIDANLQLIKGGGGALLQEKMVAAASQKLIIIADHTKMVDTLGKFPLPVEVIPYGWKQVILHIKQYKNIDITLRRKNGEIFVTDHGHYILDCSFKQIEDAQALSFKLNDIPGVVDNGLFVNRADTAIIGNADGTIKTINKVK